MQEAIARVASHMAGNLSADEDPAGVENDDTLTDADIERMNRACDIVQDRLYRMGKGGRSW